MGYRGYITVIVASAGPVGNQKIAVDKSEHMCYNKENEPGGGTVEELNKPIDVISVCAADGALQPLRFRMEGEDQCLRRVNIDQVVSTREIRHVGAEAQIFLCRGAVDGQDWLFELKYSIRSHCWCLLRRII